MHTQLNDQNVPAKLYFYARNGLKEEINFSCYILWKLKNISLNSF